MADRPKALSREAILEAEDKRLEPVEMPEWPDAEGNPGIVYVRSITGAERDTYEQSTMQLRGSTVIPKLDRARVRLVVMTACDEHGSKLFTKDDLTALAKKNARPVERLFDKARDMAGLTQADLEELVGNSEGDQRDGSSSDSL